MGTRRDSQLLVFQDFLYFSTDNFAFLAFKIRNTYLDTEFSIISLRFGGLEVTLEWFSP